LTQDRVVLSQGSQMRCRVEPGMDRLKRNISSFIGVVVNCLVGSTLQFFSHLVQWIVEYKKKSANLYYSNIA
jgi:hypothetical protein